jgi:hypothetical protein
MVHHSLKNAEALDVDPHCWQVRVYAYDYVMSVQAQEVIEQEGTIQVNYAMLPEVR